MQYCRVYSHKDLPNATQEQKERSALTIERVNLLGLLSVHALSEP
jgi:hypothetical protein